MLLDAHGRPISEGTPVLVDPDGIPLSSDQYEDLQDVPIEEFTPIPADDDEGMARDRAVVEALRKDDGNPALQPAAIAADLISQGRIRNLSRSERMILRANLIASEMSLQNLQLWVALHGVASAAGIKAFQVSKDKFEKWGSTNPTKWPISAARLASGSIAFEILDEEGMRPSGTPDPKPEAKADAG